MNAPVLALRLHPADDVLIATRQLVAGMQVEGVRIIGLVPAGHKVAARAVAAGASVHRYGQPIGVATKVIRAGEHVHVHNLAVGELPAARHRLDVAVHEAPSVSASGRTFDGIVRADGRVATRNYVGVLTTVNCSATVARAIADHFRRDLRPQALAGFPNVDGVIALTHSLGCGIDREGEGLRVLQRTLAGYARHANFAAVLVVGLGCETNQVDALLQAQGLARGASLSTFTIQDSGGTARAVERGIAAVAAMLPRADEVRRRPVPAAHLCVGLQCGGSDGHSGITANPVLGAAVDRLVALGGTAVLSETPEIHGAEHLLTRRARTPEIAERLLARVRWWEAMCARHGASLDNNPSPGNKAGGLTTILEKSLGAIAKAGTSPLNAVYEYAEPVSSKGLVFMDSPGFDPVSATGQVAGGANLLCFTTGRGSAYGCAPTPSLKLATHDDLVRRQGDDIDLGCGGVLDGRHTVEGLGDELLSLMLATASGRRTRSEVHGYGQNEFVPWSMGVVT